MRMLGTEDVYDVVIFSEREDGTGQSSMDLELYAPFFRQHTT